MNYVNYNVCCLKTIKYIYKYLFYIQYGMDTSVEVQNSVIVVLSTRVI